MEIYFVILSNAISSSDSKAEFLAAMIHFSGFFDGKQEQHLFKI